eukprot:1159611-Pelagomonas_calceolata.AAC.11
MDNLAPGLRMTGGACRGGGDSPNWKKRRGWRQLRGSRDWLRNVWFQKHKHPENRSNTFLLLTRASNQI